MGCSASFLFKPEDFSHITHYNESSSEQFGLVITVTKEIDPNTLPSLQNSNASQSRRSKSNKEVVTKLTQSYISINPKLELTFQNRLRRIENAYPEPINQLVWIYKGIEYDIPRVHSQIDTEKLKKKGKEAMTYLEVEGWDKTLREEFMIRKMRKKKFEEIELWNLLYCTVVVFTQMEIKELPIDENLRIENFVIRDGGFVYIHRRLYDQQNIFPTKTQSNHVNNENFNKIFTQLLILLFHLGLQHVPYKKLLKLYDLESQALEQEEGGDQTPNQSQKSDDGVTFLMEELFSVLWAKYHPQNVKRNFLF